MYTYTCVYNYISIYKYIHIYLNVTRTLCHFSPYFSLLHTHSNLVYTHDVHTENGGKLEEYASIHIYVCICIHKCVHITSKHTRKRGQVWKVCINTYICVHIYTQIYITCTCDVQTYRKRGHTWNECVNTYIHVYIYTHVYFMHTFDK